MFGKDLNKIGLEINFPSRGISLSGGSAAAYLQISGRLSGLTGNKTQASQLGLWLSLAKM
jgi:hypothetical protein